MANHLFCVIDRLTLVAVRAAKPMSSRAIPCEGQVRENGQTMYWPGGGARPYTLLMIQKLRDDT